MGNLEGFKENQGSGKGKGKGRKKPMRKKKETVKGEKKEGAVEREKVN